MSDSLATNKVMAAVLVCGIAFMACNLASEALVSPAKLAHTAIKIDVKEAVVAAPVAAVLPPIATMLAKADPAQGQAIMQKQCSVCHNWDEGGPAKVGPNLYGIVGAAHAHMAGFNYSSGLEAMKGKPWTFAELNVWLHNPRDVVPGTRMSYAGLESDQQRADVIDYLHTLSHSPEALPAPGSDAPPVAPATGAAAGNAAAHAAPATPATNGAMKPGAGGSGHQDGTGVPTRTDTGAGSASGTDAQRTETEKAANSTTNSQTPQPGATPGGNPAGAH